MITDYNFKHRMLFAMLHQRGLINHRASLIIGVTNGRTSSIKDITDAEMDELITVVKRQPMLNVEQIKQQNTKTIIGLSYGVHELASHLNLITDDKKPNYSAINYHIDKKFPSQDLQTISIEQQKEFIGYLKILKTNYQKK